MRRLAFVLGLLLALVSSPAIAETFDRLSNGQTSPGTVLLCYSSGTHYVPCDAGAPLSVNIVSGGGSGGTASSFGAAFPATGTAIGLKNGINMVNGTADGSGNLNVNCAVGCSGGSFNNNSDNVATSSSNGQAAAWNYVWDGATWDRLYGDSVLGAFVQVKASVLPTGAATAAKQPALGTAGSASTDVLSVQGIASMTPFLVAQSGTWNLTNISGTVSLPTGAATAAKQPALGTAGAASTDVVTVQGIASMTPFQSAQSGTWNVTNISGTVSLPTGAATSANQTNASAKTQVVDGSGNVISATSNALDVNVKTVATKTGVVAGTTTITTGGTSQTLFTAATIVSGAFVTNPSTATEALCVDPTGAAATTTEAGSTFCLQKGQTFTVPAGWATAVTVNAVTTSHAFSAVRY